jgi:hypothetical protein
MTITIISQLLTFRETVAIYSENHMKTTSTL